MKPGEAMPSERELMERFGVGRPAIREAMQSLANMGLVEISHGETRPRAGAHAAIHHAAGGPVGTHHAVAVA